MEERKRGFGAGLLKGASVIMTVFGVLEVILFVLALAGVILANSATVNLFSGEKEILGASILLAAGLSELLCGIFGRRCVKVGGGAAVCLVLGLICLGLTLTSLLMIGNKMDPVALLTLVLSGVLPVVYLLAAWMTRREQRA